MKNGGESDFFFMSTCEPLSNGVGPRCQDLTRLLSYLCFKFNFSNKWEIQKRSFNITYSTITITKLIEKMKPKEMKKKNIRTAKVVSNMEKIEL